MKKNTTDELGPTPLYVPTAQEWFVELLHIALWDLVKSYSTWYIHELRAVVGLKILRGTYLVIGWA